MYQCYAAAEKYYVHMFPEYNEIVASYMFNKLLFQGDDDKSLSDWNHKKLK